MSKIPTIFYPFVLTLVTLVTAGTIAAIGHPVPGQLWTLSYVFGGATTGVVIPQVAAKAPQAP